MSNKAEQEQQILSAKPEQFDNEKKYSKLQWLLFVIIIPLLFAIVIALVVMTIAGINVFDIAQKVGEKIPGISTMISDETNEADVTKSVYTLKATIEDQEVEIAKLQAEIDSKQNELSTSQEEIDRLTEELTALIEKEQEATIKLEELAKVYETMSAKKSAAIFTEMKNEETLEILVKMNNEARAAILEKMDPLKAAELTVLLKAEEEAISDEINSEQEEVLASGNRENTDGLN